MSDTGKPDKDIKRSQLNLSPFLALYNKSVLSTAGIVSRPDSELESKVKKATERICENLHIVANEPSLAFYRISEHVRKVSLYILITQNNVETNVIFSKGAPADC